MIITLPPTHQACSFPSSSWRQGRSANSRMTRRDGSICTVPTRRARPHPMHSIWTGRAHSQCINSACIVHGHVFICFATKTTIRSQSATPFSRKTNKNQPFFHHNQRKKMRNRFDAAYTTNFHNRTMKSVGQLHVCAVKWRPINKASFCCRKKWESWIFAQTSQTPIIYSSDLFTYNAKYFQTFLGEKWHRTWLES